MSAQPTQNYQNHTNTPVLFMVIVIMFVLAIALELAGYFMAMPILMLIAFKTLAIGAGLLAYKDRMGDLCLQDRIIRLEMRVRLKELGLGEQAEKLALNQLVALRFASDAELPALVNKVLSEGIAKGSEIKKQIKNWVGDHRRV